MNYVYICVAAMIMYKLSNKCLLSLSSKHHWTLIMKNGHNNLFNRINLLCKYSTQLSNGIFKGENDIFHGVNVDSLNIECNSDEFTKKLEDSLARWSLEGKRCIWFKVHLKDSCYVPLLAQKNFKFHHARNDFLMMFKWLPMDQEPNLPPSSHTNLGVGGVVFNDRKQLLVISEKSYDYPHWKLPGGYVERGEDIPDAAVREVKEETGVDSCFQSLITFRHSHNMTFGNSDIYVLLMMKALSDKIVISNREIKECQWMEIDEYLTHPHVHNFNRLIVKTALEYKARNLKLNILKETVKWSRYTRDMNFLRVEEFKYD